MKIIRGKQTFTNEFGINRWNLNTLEKDMSRDIFQVSWLTYLVQKYGVSSTWLLTGRGEILAFNKDKRKRAKPINSLVLLLRFILRQALCRRLICSVSWRPPPVCSCLILWHKSASFRFPYAPRSLLTVYMSVPRSSIITAKVCRPNEM